MPRVTNVDREPRALKTSALLSTLEGVACLTYTRKDHRVVTDDAVDAELARAAQGGDKACLATLLTRHRADMLAVALAVLGRPAEAEDAVQDAAVVALTSIGALRDPMAVGPWLRTIVRNSCLMRQRRRTPLLTDDIAALIRVSADEDPARILERRATRDWVRDAVEQLSVPLRTVTILRYFAGVTSSDAIGALCGIPAGTVRSRLSQARGQLTRGLAESASTAYGDASALSARWWREAEGTVRAANRGQFGTAVRPTWRPDLEMTWGDGRQEHGLAPVVRSVNADMDYGIRHRLVDVVASREILVWRTDLVNPPEDPYHCPPQAIWLLFLEDERIRRFRLFHTERTDRPRTGRLPAR
jgi:RNA polymerase sigma factor (sigma-70 family)